MFSFVARLTTKLRVHALRRMHRGKLSGRTFTMRGFPHVRIIGSGHIQIGDGAHIDAHCRLVAQNALLALGKSVYVGRNSTIVAFDTVEIGDGTLIGENVSIHSENHGPVTRRGEYTTGKVLIGRGCWIGAGVVITAGVTIGEGCTIGANAVVTADVLPNSLAVGVPARVIRTLET